MTLKDFAQNILEDIASGRLDGSLPVMVHRSPLIACEREFGGHSYPEPVMELIPGDGKNWKSTYAVTYYAISTR